MQELAGVVAQCMTVSERTQANEASKRQREEMAPVRRGRRGATADARPGPVAGAKAGEAPRETEVVGLEETEEGEEAEEGSEEEDEEGDGEAVRAEATAARVSQKGVRAREANATIGEGVSSSTMQSTGNKTNLAEGGRASSAPAGAAGETGGDHIADVMAWLLTLNRPKKDLDLFVHKSLRCCLLRGA